MSHLRELGKSKKFDKRVLDELSNNRKITVLNCLLFFYATRTTRFSTGCVMWRKRWLAHDQAPQHFPKHQQRLWLVLGCLKLNYRRYLLSVNLWNVSENSTIAVSVGQHKRIDPSSRQPTRSYVAQPPLQKLNKRCYGTRPHPSYLLDLSSTDYHFFNHFANFKNQRR